MVSCGNLDVPWKRTASCSFSALTLLKDDRYYHQTSRVIIFNGGVNLSSPLDQNCSLLRFLPQAAWRTGACVLSGVLETVFGAEVYREGASEFGLYCDHVLRNRYYKHEKRDFYHLGFDTSSIQYLLYY